MGLVFHERVMETTTTTGTGDITLAGAVTGFRDFDGVLEPGDEFDYTIFACDADGVPSGDWESGRGTFTSPATLVRGAVSANSAGTTAKIDFAAGTKRVMISVSADTFQTVADATVPVLTAPTVTRPTVVQATAEVNDYTQFTLAAEPTPGNVLIAILVTKSIADPQEEVTTNGWVQIYASGFSEGQPQQFILASSAYEGMGVNPTPVTSSFGIQEGVGVVFEVANWSGNFGHLYPVFEDIYLPGTPLQVGTNALVDESLAVGAFITYGFEDIVSLDNPLLELDNASGLTGMTGAFAVTAWSTPVETTDEPTISGTVSEAVQVWGVSVSIRPSSVGGGAGGKLPLLPPGGTTGQVLVKLSDDDYDVAWQTPA